MNTVYWVFGALTAVAAFTDYKSGKIYNWLTFPAMLAGFGIAAYFGNGMLIGALQGWGLAFAVFAPLFFLGIMGAGDAKLMMALGTVLGPQATLDVVLWSLAFAGVGGLILLFAHKRQGIFATEILHFLQSLFTPGLKLQWPKLSKDITAPFGLAIFAAFVVVRCLS